jgi:hypothetical protein
MAEDSFEWADSIRALGGGEAHIEPVLASVLAINMVSLAREFD